MTDVSLDDLLNAEAPSGAKALPQVPGEGPAPARVMIVGEAPGQEELIQGAPFRGASGQLLNDVLQSFGQLRTECYVTNVSLYGPPNGKIELMFDNKSYGKAHRQPNAELRASLDRLYFDIDRVKPEIIIALGDVALWALTGERGIIKWRGSQLDFEHKRCEHKCLLVPTVHPAYVMRQYEDRVLFQRDIQRALTWCHSRYRPPEPRYIVRPSFAQVMEILRDLEAGASLKTPVHLAGDIETRKGHIACFGFSWSDSAGLCIPFMCVERNEGYWTLDEEQEIVLAIVKLFRNPFVRWYFQNGLYDFQYFARYWGVIPHLELDTMLGHHLLYPNMRKGLDVLSSLYCRFHRYWKDDGKEWHPKMDEEQLWRYNLDDCARTYESAQHIIDTIQRRGLESQCEFQHEQFHVVLRMMLRGVRTDPKKRAELSLHLTEEIMHRQSWLDRATPESLNARSPQQMQKFFYGLVGAKVIRDRKTGRPTTNDKALRTIAKREPWIRPIVRKILEIRSIGVFNSTFIRMRLDHDNRLRTSYNVAGTETFRWSSSANAFGSGGNLQNIPKGGEDPTGELELDLPNVRSLFLPDPGYTICECDLDRADAQVVAWEAHDDELKAIFREGADLHMENARAIFGSRAGKRERQLAKIGVHATNYGSRERTLAIALGITVHEATRFQDRWFAAHPGILDWHRRIEDALITTRRVENKFGFGITFYGRIESAFTEALAWIPQSTVALVIDKGLVRVDRNLRRDVQILMQVHDSGIFQIETCKFRRVAPKLLEALQVVIPYDDPLVIPVGMEASERSWGDAVATVEGIILHEKEKWYRLPSGRSARRNAKGDLEYQN